jgi:lipid-A-disaccharide synthase
LPGSRKQEINYILPQMLRMVPLFPDYQFVIAGAPSFNQDFYKPYLGQWNIPIIFNAAYDILNIAHAAIVTSGTATLETALFKVPQVVVYKGNPISIGIARLLVKIKFISLVNLIMDQSLVKELIQEDCNVSSLSNELRKLLSGHSREKMLIDYEELAQIMGEPGASEKTALLINQYLKDSK